MTVPGKGGRPSKVKNPKIAGTVVAQLANGATLEQAGRAAGASKDTARRVRMAHGERIQRARERAETLQIANVLSDLARATQARMRDACNEESRTGAQSYRVALEGAGLIGKPPMIIGGDLNVVHVDASQQVHLSGASEAELRQRLAELDDRLGL